MTADPYRTWDAAYVLGALSADERAEYEEHLAGCAECRAAVGELAGVPGVLGRLDRDTALSIVAEPPSSTMPHDDLVPRLARRTRRTRRVRRVLVAGGIVAGIAAGLVVGVAVQPTIADAGATSVDLASVDRTAVTGHVRAEAAAWGTRLDWDCSYGDDVAAARYAGVRYELTVTTDDGRVHDVASWSAAGSTSSGLSASVALPRSSIRSVSIRTTGGTALATGGL